MAVAQALKSQPDNKLHYIGLGDAREQALVAPTGIPMHKITAGKFRRYHTQTWLEHLLDVRTVALNVRDSFRVAAGFVKSLWLLVRLRPDRVFIKGGFVGLPVGLAAWVLRIPFIIHESDSRPGLANRVLARLTPHRISGFDVPGFINLGNPVRLEILGGKVNRALFGITSSKPVVLVVGGSLGSRQLNTAITQLIDLCDRYEIIHITGNNQEITPDKSYYHPYPFLGAEMADALQTADVVISRAGANTLAELAALKKPSLIIPHPHLSDQLKNAQHLAEADAVLTFAQAELSGIHLIHELDVLFAQPEKLDSLRENIAQFQVANSAELIGRMIIELTPPVEQGRVV